MAGRRFFTAALAVLLAVSAWAAPALGESHITVHTHGDRDVPRIAVTVDDWYEPELLGAFLDAAAEYGCRLTLYPVGINLRASDRALWQRAVDEGHELGNHSNTHRKLGDLSRDSILKQLGNMEKNLAAALGYEYPVNTLRYPFGDGRHKGTRSAFAAVVREAGYAHVVLWDVDDGPAREILRKTQNGSIILLHGNRKSLKTLKIILPQLAARGYEMVTVSELLGLGAEGPAPVREDAASPAQSKVPLP